LDAIARADQAMAFCFRVKASNGNFVTLSSPSAHASRALAALPRTRL
jgi:hypothetical protein